MVSELDFSAALTLGVAVPLPAADVEEKAATARRRILAACQLLDEEQAAAADLEWLVPGSTSFSIMETVTASSSYVDTIVANLHIQVDTMMEEIHLDTSSPAAALTTFYSNKTLSAPLLSPRPPGKNNGSGSGNGNGNNNNRQRNNNCHNGGSDSKNNDNGGNRGGNTSSNTTVVSHSVTTNDGRGPPPWPTSVNPLQGHITMYPSPLPTGQQQPQAFMATTGPYTLPGFVPGPQQLYQ
jgi:hypothetical protein